MRKSILVLMIVFAIVFAGMAALQAADRGEVIVYSASGPEITTPIFDLFKENYPDIKITIIHADTPELFARIEAEKANPSADLMFGGSPLTYNLKADLFQAYDNPEKDNFITSDPNNIYQPFSLFCQPLMVNTKLVSPDEYPSTVQEMLEMGERWVKDGGIVLADSNKSSTGWTIISGLATAFSWEFIEELLLYTEVTPGSSPMFQAVRDGEAPIGWVNEDLGIKWFNEGLPVKLIYPTDAVTMQMDAFGIIKGGPNPEMAEILAEFLSTREVHVIASEIVKRRSVRTDVTPPGDLPELGNLNLYYASEPRDVVNAKFADLIEKVQ